MNECKKIVIVDDHAMFRKGLAALINLFQGYEILADFNNGAECIAAVNAGIRPDIVLLDVSMPELDGFETARYLRDHFSEIKVLALSTMESELVIIRMIRNGARGYILKDADPSDLRQAFDEVMSLGYYYSKVVSKQLIHSMERAFTDKSPKGIIQNLTNREYEFLRLACSEKTYRQISQEMFLSERTIDGYRESLFQKLDVNTRVGLVLYAIRNKLVNIQN